MGEHEEKAGVGAHLREHGPLLARVAMAFLGEQAAVERALEQVAREAAKSPRRDADASATRVWLLGLVRTACAAESTRAARRTSRGIGEETGPQTRRDPVADAVLARRTLARLKPTEREALVLHLVGGLDARGVAAACSIGEEVARGRIASAVSQLLEEEGR